MTNNLNHKAMKRLLTIGLVLVSAFALTNCSEQIVPPVEEEVIVDETIETTTPEGGIPFEVYANFAEDADTKTVNFGNSTYWVCEDNHKDQISVFHSEAGKNKYTHNHVFTISDLNENEGLFTGNLKSGLFDTNDWFFIYPYSSSAGTLSNIPLTFGQSNVSQKVDNAKGHIAGAISPMYGTLKNNPANENPEIVMNHLAALVGIKMVNKTNGPITVNNAKIVARVKTGEDENGNDIVNNLPLVGDFEVNCTTEDTNGNFKPTFTPIPNKTSNIVTITLDKDEKVETGESFTFYFAAVPSKTQLNYLTVYINGSEKAISSESEIEFKSGEVTTLKLEVKHHSYPKDSEAALNLKSQGDVEGEAWVWVKDGRDRVLEVDDDAAPDETHAECSLVTMENYYSETININNEDVKVYVLGKASQTAATTAGKITIRGWAKDIINALSAGFYTSRWNDQATSMILESINIHIPEYARNSYYDFTGMLYGFDFSKLKTRVPIIDKWGDLIGAINELMDDVNIPIGDNGITLETLTALNIPTSTVTFSGMIPNCGFNDTDIKNSNVLMLDEDRTYKWIDGADNGNVATYVDKFSYRPESGTHYVATLSGLKEILYAQPGTNGKITWTDAARETGNAIYNRICQILATRVGSELIAATGLRAIGFKDAEAIMYSIRDMKFEVCISTHPVNNNYYPVVVWGLGANVDTSGTSN